jgi:hypothetical protein
MSRMFKAFCLWLLVAAFAASPARAVPAPMSEQELAEKSDIIALVRVISVTCTSVVTDKATGEELPNYLARLLIVEAKKGNVAVGDEVLVTWHAVSTKIVGPWTVNYYPGEEVWTHLKKRDVGVAYASTWLNAKGDVVKAPESTALPTKPGETLAPAKSHEPTQRVPL